MPCTSRAVAQRQSEAFVEQAPVAPAPAPAPGVALGELQTESPQPAPPQAARSALCESALSGSCAAVACASRRTSTSANPGSSALLLSTDLAETCTVLALHYAGGAYSSPERMNGDFTHGFLMTFDSPESRDIYLPHPEHERVKSMIVPHIKNVIAFDCEDASV